MQFNFKNVVPHVVVLLLFVLISVIYFKPVLSGKVIYQSDIAQYTGMAKERNDYKEQTGEESYWTDSAFGGMPTYQLGANYPYNFVKKLDKVLRFLPRPADYLFLYFVGFYLLMLVLKVDYKLAFLGALGFGFSTYLIIILGVGHNAKAHAIAYFPLVLAGFLLVFRQKYLWGTVVSALAMALEINANHFQMTYYLGFLLLAAGIAYAFEAVMNKNIPSFLKSTGVFIVAIVLGFVMNAVNLMATQEYTKWSTRGVGELSFNPDGSEKEKDVALDKDYITYYSYGVVESLNLFVPRMFGGSNAEDLGEKSKTYEYLTANGVPRSQALGFSQSLPSYWGPQPGTAAPAYVGAVMLFFFVLGLLLVKKKIKWWLLAGVLVSLFLSWGKNFMWLTALMIDYFPLYDKFRAVSSIQVVLEFCVPILGVLGLVKLLDHEVDLKERTKALFTAAGVLICLGILLFVFKSSFNFAGETDITLRQYYGADIVSMIQEDRKSMYTSDLLRSLGLVLLAAILALAYLKDMLKKQWVIAGLALLVAVDLIGVAARYVNADDFVSKSKMNTPFQLTAADQKILEDKGHFRVYNQSEGLNGANTSYFHNSIGGYHGAKPRAMQELFEYQIAKNNVGILNMLNVKYIITQNEKGQVYPAVNPYTNGNAWFVTNIKEVNTSDDEMRSLDSLNTKIEAVFNTDKFSNLKLKTAYTVDSTATITLDAYTPNKLTYTSKNKNEGVAVFSEMYYPKGWHATIDGKSATIFEVNYALRALQVPAGTHKITFEFDPQVVKTGSTLMLAGNIIFLLLFAGGVWFSFKKQA